MAHTPNVHIEHLPAGRYGARPNDETGPEIGLSKDDLGGHLQHPKLTHSDHHLLNPHGYHNVDQVGGCFVECDGPCPLSSCP